MELIKAFRDTFKAWLSRQKDMNEEPIRDLKNFSKIALSCITVWVLFNYLVPLMIVWAISL